MKPFTGFGLRFGNIVILRYRILHPTTLASGERPAEAPRPTCLSPGGTDVD
jgi:hypothetical protein